MPRTFKYAPGPHWIANAPQLAIQAHDLTRAECRLLRAIVTNNWIDSPSYKLGRACSPFLQGYEEPWASDPNSGWVLVEFWTSDEAAIQTYVDHVNAEFVRMEAAQLTLDKSNEDA